MLYYLDLETCFLAKGFKRSDQQILEIGIVHGRRAYKCLVNPVAEGDLIEGLARLGQDPEKSIRFWTKLLCEKRVLNTAVRRKSIEEQAAMIDRVRHEMKTPEQAIRGMLAFGRQGTYVAYNGNSFDHKIIQAHLRRFDIPHRLRFADPLPFVRRTLGLKSHALGAVYKHLFHRTFRQHHALDDAIALQRICKRLNFTPSPAPPVSPVTVPRRGAPVSRGTPLRSIKGIGPKSERVFLSHGIRSVEDLKHWVSTHKITDWHFNVHHAKSLARRLFH